MSEMLKSGELITGANVNTLKVDWGNSIVEQEPVTKEDIARLKAQWANDPCWDIEETEGFEEYYTELSAFRIEMENQWTNENNAMILAKSQRLGCSPQLAEYISNLEHRITKLEIRTDRIEFK